MQEGAPADEAAPESHVYLRRLWLAGTLQQQAKVRLRWKLFARAGGGVVGVAEIHMGP